MGGGAAYSSISGENTRSTFGNTFSTDGMNINSDHLDEETTLHADLDPKGKNLESCDSETNPEARALVVAMDLTLSRGSDAIKIYDGLPKFIALLKALDYMEYPAISFAGVGDKTDEDRFPLQATYFESGNILDDALANMRVEQGGGGTGKESYELLAYLYARKSILDCLKKRGDKGILFIIGDESPYQEVSKEQVKLLIGDDLPANIPTAKIFEQLQELYEVYFIYPKMSAEERAKGIESEIKKRAREAGGRVDNVDIRATLIWNTRDDLDVHLINPKGYEIFYQNKKDEFGGWLDIDMNVRGETTKPVENIRYPRGSAPAGKVQIFVENYAYHDREFHQGKRKPIPFQIEVEINGKLETFNLECPADAINRNSRIMVKEFDYNPAERPAAKDVQEAYADGTILSTWKSLIPEENVIVLDDSEEIIDTMLGVVAIVTGKEESAESFVSTMMEHDTTESRGKALVKSLDFLSSQKALTIMTDISGLPERSGDDSKRVETQSL